MSRSPTPRCGRGCPRRPRALAGEGLRRSWGGRPGPGRRSCPTAPRPGTRRHRARPRRRRRRTPPCRPGCVGVVAAPEAHDDAPGLYFAVGGVQARHEPGDRVRLPTAPPVASVMREGHRQGGAAAAEEKTEELVGCTTTVKRRWSQWKGGPGSWPGKLGSCTFASGPPWAAASVRSTTHAGSMRQGRRPGQRLGAVLEAIGAEEVEGLGQGEVQGHVRRVRGRRLAFDQRPVRAQRFEGPLEGRLLVGLPPAHAHARPLRAVAGRHQQVLRVPTGRGSGGMRPHARLASPKE